MKICNKCKEEKEIQFFSKDKYSKDGYCFTCKNCRNKHNAEYRKDPIHKQRHAEIERNRRRKPEVKKAISLYKKEYSIKPEVKKRVASYIATHKEEIQSNRRIYESNRKKSDICFSLSKTVRIRLSSIFRYKRMGLSLSKDLGCSWGELKRYLESKFKPCMTWNNRGNKLGYWVIDHIVPLSWFDLTNPDQFKYAVHYTNLQPMWHEDNQRKLNHYAY